MSSSASLKRGATNDGDGEDAKRQRGSEEQQQQELRMLPEGVVAVGAMNNKSRILIPGKGNFFAGIECQYVMIDNGCNSLLLPFPEDKSRLNQFKDADLFSWKISSSQGTGTISSPTLTIKRRLDLPIGEMILALANGPFPLPRLRFNITKDAANYLRELQGTDLDASDVGRLEAFLTALGENDSSQRKHALLGQLFLKDRMCIQNDPVFMVTEKNYGGPLQLALSQIQRRIGPLIDSFEEFHDLEDEDHDGDDNEEKRRSWGSDEDIDEPNF